MAVCALAVATAASAQVTGVVTSRSVNVQDLYDSLGVAGDVGNSATQYAFPNGSSPYFQAIENYQVSANVTPREIDFANNATSQGFFSSTSTTTSIDVTYKNGGSKAIRPTLQSTILPGGFGFYMDEPQNNPTLANFAIGDVNQTPQSTDATFTNISGYAGQGAGGAVGYAGFTFDILSGGTLIKSYSGSVALFLAPASPFGVTFSVVASAAPLLRGFKLVTPAGSDQAVGYQWDTTNVRAPLGVTLAPGASSTLTYVSTVTTASYIQNFNNCTVENVCPQLLAYSGFGDPIGKSGGTGSNVATPIGDPYFPLFQLSLPTFDDTTGLFTGPSIQAVLPSLPLDGVPPAPFTPIPASVLSAVPEPGAWVMMLAGLALTGAALRRRPRRIEVA